MLWSLWVAVALGQSSDLVRTSVGTQATQSTALGQGDVDLFLGEQVRWRLSDGARLWLDGAFTIDPDAANTFERSRVRQVGVELHRGAVEAWLGRQPVRYGGPRLVDGAQVLLHAGSFTFGAWGGLAPDLFTTRPELRPGGGPLVAWEVPAVQVSVAGEVLVTEGGLDRAGTLVQGRVEGSQLWDLSGRLDWQFGDTNGQSGLSDGAVFGQLRANQTFRLDLLYNAFSTYRYQQTALLDPTLQRFVARTDALAQLLGMAPETVDPTVHHLVGATPRVHSKAVDLSVLVRARHGDEAERYLRLQPRLAMRGGLDDRLEVQVDANFIHLDTGWSSSAGPTVLLELAPERNVWLDGSVRAVFDPAYQGPGGYADLFVDWLGPAGLTLMAGGAWEYEPVAELNDVGLTAYLRAMHTFQRPSRGED